MEKGQVWYAASLSVRIFRFRTNRKVKIPTLSQTPREGWGSPPGTAIPYRLIIGGYLGVIDDQDLHRVGSWFQLQAKLLLNCGGEWRSGSFR